MKFSTEDIFETMAEEITRGPTDVRRSTWRDDADFRELEVQEKRIDGRLRYRAGGAAERARKARNTRDVYHRSEESKAKVIRRATTWRQENRDRSNAVRNRLRALRRAEKTASAPPADPVRVLIRRSGW